MDLRRWSRPGAKGTADQADVQRRSGPSLATGPSDGGIQALDAAFGRPRRFGCGASAAGAAATGLASGLAERDLGAAFVEARGFDAALVVVDGGGAGFRPRPIFFANSWRWAV